MFATEMVLPYFFHRMMAKKLIEWDKSYATEHERILAIEQNKKSGIPLLVKHT